MIKVLALLLGLVGIGSGLAYADSSFVATPSPSIAKAWAYCTNSAGTYTLAASYNISGATCGKTGTGALTISFTTAFTNSNYACVGTIAAISAALVLAIPTNSSSVGITIVTSVAGAAVDNSFSLVCFGN